MPASGIVTAPTTQWRLLYYQLTQLNALNHLYKHIRIQLAKYIIFLNISRNGISESSKCTHADGITIIGLSLPAGIRPFSSEYFSQRSNSTRQRRPYWLPAMQYTMPGYGQNPGTICMPPVPNRHPLPIVCRYSMTEYFPPTFWSL